MGNERVESYGFNDDYKRYIENLKRQKIIYDCVRKNSCPYNDPDSESDFYDLGKTYYERINKYMEKRKEGVWNDVTFIAPDGGKNNKEECEDQYKIVMKKKRDEPLMLTSDQFGFSAPFIDLLSGLSAWNSERIKYPYSSYIIYSQDKDKYGFVANCIRDTRTLGGSFLWPVKKKWNKKSKEWEGKRVSVYNRNRGVNSYIEDRVDLTLLEIKHFYEKKDYKKDILLSGDDSDKIKEWLGLFKSFEKYVNFFMFHPFVVNIGRGDKLDYVPIDIVNSLIKEEGEDGKGDSFGKEDVIASQDHEIQILSSRPTLSEKSICDECKAKDCCKMNGKEIKEIQKCLIHNPDKLKRMLNNVRLLTLARSRMMEAVINNAEMIPYTSWIKEGDETKLSQKKEANPYYNSSKPKPSES